MKIIALLLVTVLIVCGPALASPYKSGWNKKVFKEQKDLCMESFFDTAKNNKDPEWGRPPLEVKKEVIKELTSIAAPICKCVINTIAKEYNYSEFYEKGSNAKINSGGYIQEMSRCIQR